jgi:hypothetical protein
MKGNKVFFSAMIALMSLAKPAHAQKPELVTDRPDQSNTPLLVPKGALQIETGFLAEQANSAAFRQTNYTYNSSLLKYGINENFEFRFNTVYEGTRTIKSDVVNTSGMGPMSVGMKIKLAEASGVWPQAAVITNINLKTGSNEFAPSYTATDITLSCAHTLTDRLSLTYNTGVKWNGDSPEATFLYTLSFGYAFNSKLAVFGESYGFFPEAHIADHRLDAGLTYKIAPMVQYDISSGLGLSKNSPNYFISTGLTLRLFK